MDELLRRLRERKLGQWALAYAAGAFALAQAVDFVAQRFGWPEAVTRGSIVLLAVGFVVALVLAWYHGDGGVQRVTRTELAIVTVLLALGGGLLWRYAPGGGAAETGQSAPRAASTSETPAKSIAVLPFANMSGDPKNDFFSDGITEEILNALAQIPDLKVAARTSAFAFKGRHEDLRAIGERLGVAHVLEGSVQSAGDEVRITAQLIDAHTGFHLWSERYDRKLTSVFAIEDEISRAIADKLRTQWGEAQALVRDGTREPRAHAAYLQGIAAIARRGAALTDAATLLEEATALDPNYAAAWAQLSQVHELLPWYELEPWEAGLATAERTARRALELDPQSAEAHAALANVLRDRFQFGAAEREYQHSLELNPGDSEVHNQYGQLLGAIGRFADALEHERIAAALDPLAPNPHYMIGIVLCGVRRHEAAIAAFDTAIRTAPEFRYSYGQRSYALLFAGRHAEAEAAARVAAERAGEDPKTAAALVAAVADPARRASALPLVAGAYWIGQVKLGGLGRSFWYAQLGEPEKSIEELQRWADTAEQGERFNGLRFAWFAAFDPVRADARFQDVMRRLGVPELDAAALRELGQRLPSDAALLVGSTKATAVP